METSDTEHSNRTNPVLTSCPLLHVNEADVTSAPTPFPPAEHCAMTNPVFSHHLFRLKIIWIPPSILPTRIPNGTPLESGCSIAKFPRLPVQRKEFDKVEESIALGASSSRAGASHREESYVTNDQASSDNIQTLGWRVKVGPPPRRFRY